MTDERLKQLMEQVGMPNSISLYGALQQAENEGFQAGAASRDAEVASLKAENESLLKNLRGKHALTGATYAHLIKERDQLSEQVTLLREVMNRIAFSRVDTCENIALELFNREAWAIEALDATDPTSTRNDT